MIDLIQYLLTIIQTAKLMVGLISLAATIIEDLKQGIVYSHLTNTNTNAEDLNNLNVFKFVLTLFILTVFFVQVKIWIFKVGHRFKIGIRSIELTQTSVGKQTFQIALALVTFNMGIVVYWVLQARFGTSDELINNTLKVYVITSMNTFNIGIMWVATTPKMSEYYKNELKYLNVFKS